MMRSSTGMVQNAPYVPDSYSYAARDEHRRRSDGRSGPPRPALRNNSISSEHAATTGDRMAPDQYSRGKARRVHISEDHNSRPNSREGGEHASGAREFGYEAHRHAEGVLNHGMRASQVGGIHRTQHPDGAHYDGRYTAGDTHMYENAYDDDDNYGDDESESVLQHPTQAHYADIVAPHGRDRDIPSTNRPKQSLQSSQISQESLASPTSQTQIRDIHSTNKPKSSLQSSQISQESLAQAHYRDIVAPHDAGTRDRDIHSTNKPKSSLQSSQISQESLASSTSGARDRDIHSANKSKSSLDSSQISQDSLGSSASQTQIQKHDLLRFKRSAAPRSDIAIIHELVCVYVNICVCVCVCVCVLCLCIIFVRVFCMCVLVCV
jgi:hypothetical protein